MKRPNILFYFTDQQCGDICGCYGQKPDILPRLYAHTDGDCRAGL